MRQYHDLLKAILSDGNFRGDRTGTGTQSIFGYQFRHNLSEGFPLLTTKKLPWKSIVVELLWFLRGDTNIKYLRENDVHIWTDDAYRVYKAKLNKGDTFVMKDEFEREILTNPAKLHWGDLGPIYGAQWKNWPSKVQIDYDAKSAHWETIDQIKEVIKSIRTNPEGRRHIVTAWNPAEIASMALPACHCLFQFYVSDNKLSCHMYQRSADVFLGVPFNIASYALLTNIIAHQTNLGVGDLVISFGDVHIYNNHRDAVAEQLAREPRPLPHVSIADPHRLREIDGYEFEDFYMDSYDPHSAIKGELSVGV